MFMRENFKKFTEKNLQAYLTKTSHCRQISLLILTIFNQTNQLLFTLKSLENLLFVDNFRGNRS